MTIASSHSPLIHLVDDDEAVRDALELLIGTIGLRELSQGGEHLGARLTPAITARAYDPAFGLLTAMTDGKTHAVIIVDETRHVIGLISQTDLLSAVASALPKAVA